MPTLRTIREEMILKLESDWLIEITEVSAENMTANQKIASNGNYAHACLSKNYSNVGV
jgi:hypothetical protein